MRRSTLICLILIAVLVTVASVLYQWADAAEDTPLQAQARQLAEVYGVRYGVSPACLMAVMERETGGTWNPQATNPQSGAYGIAQFLPAGGIWQATPYGYLDVHLATEANHVEGLAWAEANGHGDAWGIWC